MATKTSDPTTMFTDAFVSGVKQTQELALSGMGMWADLAGKAFALPQLDALPFADALVKPREVVEAGFGFAEELLATQKEFAFKLVDSMSPKASA